MVQIPKWVDDPDAPRPCPCGRPLTPPLVLVELADGAKVLAHLACVQGAMGQEDEMGF
jgi:hypothetical protein